MFSLAPSGETTDQIKKVRGCKNGTDLLYNHAKWVSRSYSVVSLSFLTVSQQLITSSWPRIPHVLTIIRCQDGTKGPADDILQEGRSYFKYVDVDID